MSDRTVHARSRHMEIVRYDRAGKWYLETPHERIRLSLEEAVGYATEFGSMVFFRLPGGRRFDALVRKGLEL